ncbi:MAG: cytochrome-c oxidase, cbb3-type subunit I [Planctomycetes bacterium]|nr:cytochrome-c oxidase, cbb3-type subunit I [Planctomycetota bacterium]
MTGPVAASTCRIRYDDAVVRGFTFASVAWGLIGLLVGLLAAMQLSIPALNFDLPFLTFGRIRPLHTNAVIFALVGNMMFAGIYYSTQRLLKARMASDLLSRIHLWGWQIIILGAALTLPFGITQSKEYAELEWFLDILVALIWVAFAVNFFWTLAVRNEKNLYVAIWFYIATVVTIPVLYIVNNLAMPVGATKSYGIFSGAQDALTQWWYGHNAVAFFLTTPILGIMYYFLPKAAERPVFSYRLSIVHFWALVFLYIWAGPHHLLYTALPDWAQSLGMVFSLMLWAPSWGGMLNGLLTLRGAWHKVRTDPVLKFFVAAVTFYGMSTFEGPLLSIKSVSALGHYTEWIIAHVHGGGLGWNGFMAAGMFYWLVPKLFGTKLHSTRMADLHFWIGTAGILFYVASLWVGGVTQGLMAQAQTPDGALQYANWVEIVNKVQPMYWGRALGGALYISGWIMMIWNLLKTAKSGRAVETEVEVPVLARTAVAGPSSARLIFGVPTILTAIGMGVLYLMADPERPAMTVIGMAGVLVMTGVVGFNLVAATRSKFQWHDVIEQRPFAFTVLVVLAILVGGAAELVPGIVINREVPRTASGELAVRPYSALQLQGRDIYVREGCYVCHSQMIRPFVDEARRYGPPSHIAESEWDHPFQWGSKRTGPDLARIGNYNGGDKYNDLWHYNHMMDPTSMAAGSIMPRYPWLAVDKVDVASTRAKMTLLRGLGVPYTSAELDAAESSYRAEAQKVVDNLSALSSGTVKVEGDSEMVALIAYLQRLGDNQIDPKVAGGK